MDSTRSFLVALVVALVAAAPRAIAVRFAALCVVALIVVVVVILGVVVVVVVVWCLLGKSSLLAIG